MKLDENHLLAYDESNVILRYEENRIRIKKDKTKEPYLFQEDRYYPTVKGALEAYLNISLKGSTTIEDIIERINKVEKLIRGSLVSKLW
tara:strand:+ start:652 stop:918 length:267 start_codon:yes stop_codon:yes gene_type:complete